LNTVKMFFDNYAKDFNEIYGTKNTLFNRILNRLFRRSMLLRFERTLKSCNPLQQSSVLDIGCGPGHYTIALARQGARKVVGIDFSEEMIKLAILHSNAAGYSSRCIFLVQDIFTYNPEEKFDHSVVMGVMDYISDPELFLKKVISLTSDNIVLSFPVAGGILALQRKLRYKKRCPLYFYTEEKLINLFSKIGIPHYQIERISRDYFVTLSLKT